MADRETPHPQAAWCVHGHFCVTFLERRKGFGTAPLDRRKSYVDVMERVLCNSLPSEMASRPRAFVSDFQAGRWTVGSTVSEIHVFVLDSFNTKRRG